MKRVTALFLACLFLLGAFTACGKTDTPPADTPGTSAGTETDAPSESTAAAETEADPDAEPEQTWRPDEMHDVKDTFDLEGRAIGIIDWSNEEGQFSMLGSSDKDATMMDLEIHDRDLYLMDMFNITYKETRFHYDYLVSGTQQLIYSGDFEWDLAHWNTMRLFTGGLAGLFADYNTMPYVDQSKAYWASNAQDSLSIANYQFMGINDFTTERFGGCYCIIFSRQLVEDNHLDDPYDLVDSGNWTFDNFLNMTNAVQRDVNGDGKYTEGDIFGFSMFNQNFVMAFYNATGNTFFVHDENNYPVFLHGEIMTAENVWDWLGRHLLNNPAVEFYVVTDLGIPERISRFSRDEILFHSTKMEELEGLRDMKNDFGVLPYPKLNADQQEYYTCGGDNVGGIGVIFTTEIPREIGAFLEIGSAYGHQKLIPHYYDNDLKRKIARDPKTSEMIDLILNNAVYDLSRLGFWFETRDIYGTAFWTGASLTTAIAALGSRADAKVADSITGFLKALNDRES